MGLWQALAGFVTWLVSVCWRPRSRESAVPLSAPLLATDTPLLGVRREAMLSLARRHSSLRLSPSLPRKVVVLDLDETLVHSTVRPLPSLQADWVIPVDMSGQNVRFFVHKRPFVDDFLRRVGQNFVVCVWTASLPAYASPVIDRLDPTGAIVQRRLFRDSCLLDRGLFLKDLRAQGFPMDLTVLVDNSPLSFKTCPANGIPIESWFENPNDRELLHLIPLLEALRTVPDVRHVIQPP